MVYIIVGIIILVLIDEATTLPLVLPSILFGLIPIVLPIVVGIFLKVSVIKPAERKVERKKQAIEKKYTTERQAAAALDRKNSGINKAYQREIEEKDAANTRQQKEQISAELAAHKARLNEINVVGTNPKTIEYLQTLIGYMESMRADSIKEAINLNITEVRIQSEQISRQFQENMRAMENRRMQEQLLDEARRTRRAEEERAAEAKKASDSLDKIQRDLDYELTYGKRP